MEATRWALRLVSLLSPLSLPPPNSSTLSLTRQRVLSLSLAVSFRFSDGPSLSFIGDLSLHH